jgi:multimeric flavodoxin WrbA
MKISILSASFREKGNTETLMQPFIAELKRLGATVDVVTLRDLHIEPCTACWTCQNVFDGPGCPKDDDMHLIHTSLLDADGIVFASPIYSWYCTPPMKSAMDRLVYSMNKYYGEVEGPCLWENKTLALITTCGYEIEDGAGVLEEGLRRYAKHSQLKYLGKLAARDIDGGAVQFTTDAMAESAQAFARKLHTALS